MKTIIVFILLLFNALAYSQTLEPVVLASGGDYGTTAIASLSYTIGETVISATKNDKTNFTEGFWSSTNIRQTIVLTDVEKEDDCIIYPNPANDFLNIKQNSQYDRLRIYDLCGKTLLEKQLDGTTTEVDLSCYTNGVYLLTLSGKHHSLTHKIVKR